MARKQVAGRESLQGLKNAPKLRPFELSYVKSTGKNLGGGSYGTVEELEINGLICAGKKLFDALIEPGNQGVQQIVDNYYRECSLLSDLRHPNVVQFLGICFLPETRLPVLVMERLDGSLDQLLESTPDIPLHVKVSILQDVTRGLVYLHNHKPPIIHRDLTARNVLLTPAMTAKVADLGNSRKLAKSMTRGIPGTLVYMPPEASDDKNKYGTSLDMFSFGHLSLFTAIQEFPGDLLPSTYPDPKAKGLKGRTPLERREVYINKLHKILNPKHALVVLIKGCLEYDADKRPVARQALDKLATVKASIPSTPYSELNKLQLEISLKQKEIELKAEQDKFSEQVGNLQEENRSSAIDRGHLRGTVSTLRGQVSKLTKQVGNLQEENRSSAIYRGHLKESVSMLRGQVSKLTAEREKKALEEERLHEEKVFFVEQCQRLCKANMSLKEEVQHLMKEKEELKEKLEATKPQAQLDGIREVAAMEDIAEPRARSQSMFEESHGTGEKGELLPSKHTSHSKLNAQKNSATVLHKTFSSEHPHYQQGYEYRAHEDNHDGPVSLPSMSASQVATLQRQNYAEDLVCDNPLFASLETQMQEVSEYVLEDGEDRVEVTGLHAPLDHNLTCRTCQRVFRLGEIQLFARHVSTCGSNRDD